MKEKSYLERNEKEKKDKKIATQILIALHKLYRKYKNNHTNIQNP